MLVISYFNYNFFYTTLTVFHVMSKSLINAMFTINFQNIENVNVYWTTGELLIAKLLILKVVCLYVRAGRGLLLTDA